MAKKSRITNINNGVELHERMVRIETKIDSIKETLEEIKHWQENRQKQLDEHERFISGQKTMNKIYWAILMLILTALISLFIHNLVRFKIP